LNFVFIGKVAVDADLSSGHKFFSTSMRQKMGGHLGAGQGGKNENVGSSQSKNFHIIPSVYFF
jgi:hypothetical protein